MKLSDLHAAAYNPRSITPDSLSGLSKSLQTFGDIAGIVMNRRTGNLVTGHQRISAIRQQFGDLEFTDGQIVTPTGEAFPIRYVDWPITKEKAANIAANNPRTQGDFTVEAQAILAELADIPEFEDLMFDDLAADLAAQFDGAAQASEPDEPAHEGQDTPAPTLPWEGYQPITQPGDIVQLGTHRLMCGDSTNQEHVDALFAGDTFKLTVTSPPYSDQRDYDTDNTEGLGDWSTLLQGVWDQLIRHAEPNSSALINLGLVHRERAVFRYWDSLIDHAEASGWPLFGWYVWDQGSGMPGDFAGRLSRSHECLFHFNREGCQINKWVETNGSAQARARSGMGAAFRNPDGSLRFASSPELIGQPFKIPDSVIRIYRDLTRGIHTKHHPAVFPVQFPEFIIKTWTQPGDIIYEPFAGAGTTVIAANNLNRQCLAMEISPRYCDVAIARFLLHIGTHADPQLLEKYHAICSS